MSLVFFNESLQTFGANRGAPDYSALIGRVRICFDLTISEHSYYASAKEFASGTSHDNRQRLGTIYITFHKMLLQSQMDSIHDTVEFPVVMFLVWGEWGGGGEGEEKYSPTLNLPSRYYFKGFAPI